MFFNAFSFYFTGYSETLISENIFKKKISNTGEIFISDIRLLCNWPH